MITDIDKKMMCGRMNILASNQMWFFGLSILTLICTYPNALIGGKGFIIDPSFKLINALQVNVNHMKYYLYPFAIIYAFQSAA